MSLEKYQRVTGALEVKNEETHFLHRFELFCLLALACMFQANYILDMTLSQDTHTLYKRSRMNGGCQALG